MWNEPAGGFGSAIPLYNCKVQVHEPHDKLRGPEQRPKSAVEICKTTKSVYSMKSVYSNVAFLGKFRHDESRSIVHSTLPMAMTLGR